MRKSLSPTTRVSTSATTAKQLCLSTAAVKIIVTHSSLFRVRLHVSGSSGTEKHIAYWRRRAIRIHLFLAQKLLRDGESIEISVLDSTAC